MVVICWNSRQSRECYIQDPWRRWPRESDKTASLRQARIRIAIHQIWSRIPPLIGILIIHGPPLTQLNNYKPRQSNRRGLRVVVNLLTALWHVRPNVHVFGHIDVGGVELVRWDAVQKAYEVVCAMRAEWSGLVGLVWWKMVAWFGEVFWTVLL